MLLYNFYNVLPIRNVIFSEEFIFRFDQKLFWTFLYFLRGVPETTSLLVEMVD